MIKPSAGGAGSCSRNRGALRGSGPRAARGRPRFDGGLGVPWARDVGAVWGCDIGISTDGPAGWSGTRLSHASTTDAWPWAAQQGPTGDKRCHDGGNAVPV